MSVVACKITENGYEIAADSITVRGYTQTKGQTTRHSKLFEINDMVVGSTGYAEEVSLFRLFVSTRKPSNPDEYSMLELLSDFSDWKSKKANDGDISNSYIIGFAGKVFAINHWLIEEVVKYEAIGAGEDFALAALHLGFSANEAVETAIELSVFCEGPVQLITKTNG
ncbi:MAG: hypothetical protein AAF485_30380 [Chloroflexota bacterium]